MLSWTNAPDPCPRPQPGIGTYTSPPGLWNNISRAIAKAADIATAWFLPNHVRVRAGERARFS